MRGLRPRRSDHAREWRPGRPAGGQGGAGRQGRPLPWHFQRRRDGGAAQISFGPSPKSFNFQNVDNVYDGVLDSGPEKRVGRELTASCRPKLASGLANSGTYHGNITRRPRWTIGRPSSPSSSVT
ncbi:hypothetical protein ACRAWD_27650 [Caulobacter segnis]